MQESAEKPSDTTVGQLLNERPDNMTYEEYRLALKLQRAALKERLRTGSINKKVSQLMPYRYGYNTH